MENDRVCRDSEWQQDILIDVEYWSIIQQRQSRRCGECCEKRPYGIIGMDVDHWIDGICEDSIGCWIGCPIKVIRKRLDDLQVKALQSIRWWDFDEEQLKNVAKYEFDINSYIK